MHPARLMTIRSAPILQQHTSTSDHMDPALTSLSPLVLIVTFTISGTAPFTSSNPSYSMATATTMFTSSFLAVSLPQRMSTSLPPSLALPVLLLPWPHPSLGLRHMHPTCLPAYLQEGSNFCLCVIPQCAPLFHTHTSALTSPYYLPLCTWPSLTLPCPLELSPL